MKKFLMGAAAICCMMMSGVLLSACGSDDNDSGTPTNPDAFKSIVMEVKFMEPQEVLDVCEATVSVNGEEETVTKAGWTKTVKSDVLPAFFSINVSMTKKSGKDWDPETSYTAYTCPVNYVIYTLTASGKKTTITESSNTSGTFKGGEKMDIMFKEFSNYSVNFTINNDFTM